MVVGIGQGSSGIAQKVSARLDRLAAKFERVATKLDTHPNRGQLRKAERLVSDTADGQILNQPGFEGNSLIYTAIRDGNSVNLGQARKNPASAPVPATPPEEPATPEDLTTPPADPTGTMIDVTA